MAWTDDDRKYIASAKLIELLRSLPEGSVVAVNAVENLSVHNADLSQIGYIDIGGEEFESDDDDDDE
jgi:hypothetical protein